MPTKLGFGVDWNNEYGDQIGKIAACRPALLVSLVNPNEPGKAAPAINSARVSVIRHYPAEQAMRGTETNKPIDNTARYWQMIKSIVALYPDSYFAYWRNEVGDDALLPYHRDEMLAWIQVAEAEGFKVAVGNFSVGVPDFGRWATTLSPLMAKLHIAGPERAVLNLHEYGFGDMTNQAEFLALRHRKIWRDNGYDSRYGRIKVVIGETGLDRDSRTGQFGPYKQIGVSNQQYYDMLKGYDAELAKDGQVLGAAVFQWGRDPQWEAYDIQGPVADSLVGYIQLAGTQPPIIPPPVVLPPAPPPPWIPPQIAGTYQVNSLSGLRIRTGPGTDYAIAGRLYDTVLVEVDEITSGWAKMTGQDWYLSAAYLTRVV
jgi:hypothetical protein